MAFRDLSSFNAFLWPPGSGPLLACLCSKLMQTVFAASLCRRPLAASLCTKFVQQAYAEASGPMETRARRCEMELACTVLSGKRQADRQDSNLAIRSPHCLPGQRGALLQGEQAPACPGPPCVCGAPANTRVLSLPLGAEEMQRDPL